MGKAGGSIWGRLFYGVGSGGGDYRAKFISS